MIQTKETNRLVDSRALELGFVLAMLVASLLISAKPAHAATLAVNSTADTDGGSCEPLSTTISFRECTLREAIEAANATLAADTIGFNIPGDRSEVRTISLISELPTITSPLTIDGYTQRGSRPNTLKQGNDAVLLVALDGRNAGQGANGLAITAANSTIRGLVINSFSGGQGVLISGARATNNRVEGNFIGTDAVGSGMIGVHISHAPGNTVGGTTPQARNVISGNSSGILISGPGASGNEVLGNFVGTDRNGGADLGNSVAGVDIRRAGNNTVGGKEVGAGNVISGNVGHGVFIFSFGTTGNRVEGNLISTQKDGLSPLGNSGSGVFLSASGNFVGGNNPEAANTIAFNGEDGVTISTSADQVLGTGNRILRNSIFSNTDLGIDLAEDGPTANDFGDFDTGPNSLQNIPVLDSARTGSRTTTIRGALRSVPNQTFVLRFFENPSGADEGKEFIGKRSVSTNADGVANFTFKSAQAVSVGRTITATATSEGGDTSEFSAPRTVVRRR